MLCQAQVWSNNGRQKKKNGFALYYTSRVLMGLTGL